MTDYAELHGEEILAELERAIITRCRPRMRRALKLAGEFLIEQRLDLLPGGQDKAICVKIAAKLNAIQFAPSFKWL